MLAMHDGIVQSGRFTGLTAAGSSELGPSSMFSMRLASAERYTPQAVPSHHHGACLIMTTGALLHNSTVMNQPDSRQEGKRAVSNTAEPQAWSLHDDPVKCQAQGKVRGDCGTFGIFIPLGSTVASCLQNLLHVEGELVLIDLHPVHGMCVSGPMPSVSAVLHSQTTLA